MRRHYRSWHPTNRFVFEFDSSEFIFPIAFHWSGVGNNNKTWSISLLLLWFSLTILIHEDAIDPFGEVE